MLLLDGPPPGLAGPGRTYGGGLDEMRDLDGVAGALPSPVPSSTESGSDILAHHLAGLSRCWQSAMMQPGEASRL